MKLAIISDTHDNSASLAAALPYLVEADAIIHCGDICSGFIIGQLAHGLSQPVHIVWGNSEGDILLMTKVAAEFTHIRFHGALAELNLDGLKVAVNHYPRIARPLAESGRYDLVCYGHDHTAHFSQIGKTDLLNPGELLGLKGQPTIALYDTETRIAEHIKITKRTIK